jgi:PAS domain S-box-containing protein
MNPESALIEEADSTIQYANKAFYSCFGLTRDEVIGKKLLNFIVPEDRASCDMEDVVTAENPTYKVAGRSRRYDGKIIWLQYVGRGIFDSKGRLTEFHELALDITELKERINDTVKNLERLNNRVKELSRTNERDGAGAVNHSTNSMALYNFSDIICTSQKMKTVIEQAKAVAERDTAILIEGESGTGKELFAHSIHNYSNRANGPFVAVNCGAIPEELIGSELFGYAGGASTGRPATGSRENSNRPHGVRCFSMRSRRCRCRSRRRCFGFWSQRP